MSIYDAHCHVDFAVDPAELAAGLASLGVRVASGTVTPSDYRRASQVLERFDNVRVGLGLHPWWIADGRIGAAEVRSFIDLLESGSVGHVNEVGLDFAPRCLARSVSCGLVASSEEAKRLQEDVFDEAMAACGGKASFVSMHSVRAEQEVLDALNRNQLPSQCACVFHGFGGSQQQLLRALDMGCYVSVGPRMLASKRGREYVKAIPVERLLLETDAPSAPGKRLFAKDMHAMLSGCLEGIVAACGLEGRSAQALSERIEENARLLLGFKPSS